MEGWSNGYVGDEANILKHQLWDAWGLCGSLLTNSSNLFACLKIFIMKYQKKQKFQIPIFLFLIL